jgi:hypothetical protein
MSKNRKNVDLEIEKRMKGIADELKIYHEKLNKEAILCKNEAVRSLNRFCETGETIFSINGEKLDINKFLRVLRAILSFEIPPISVTDVFTMPSERIRSSLEKIDTLREHLHGIPGARFYDSTPDVLEKVRIKTSVEII